MQYSKYEKHAAKIVLNHLEQLQIVSDAFNDKSILASINKDYVVVVDRVIGVLLDEQIDEDIALGQAFVLGMLQGERNAKKNSDERTTAHQSIV